MKFISIYSLLIKGLFGSELIDFYYGIKKFILIENNSSKIYNYL